MASNVETDLQQSEYSRVLEESQGKINHAVLDDYDHDLHGPYFKRVSSIQPPENRPVNKNLASHFCMNVDEGFGDFETTDYKMYRGYIQSEEEVRLFYSHYLSKRITLATLCIVHGFGEHSGRYIDICDQLVKQGFEIHTIDLRGFGMSGGPRVTASVEQLHHDIEVLIKQINKELPLFIWGHSMGAALVSSLMIRNPTLKISGVILTSPLFDLAPDRQVPAGKKWFVKAFGDSLEDIIVNSQINTTSLSKNNIEVKKVIDDRLMIPILSLKMVKSLFQLIDFNVPNGSKFNYPLLLIHGSKDALTSCAAAVNFYNKAHTHDKTLKIVTDGYHEILNDVERGEVLDLMTEWMTNRTKGAKNFGSHNPLRLGIVKKRSSYSKFVWALLIVLYLVFLRRNLNNPLLNSRVKWILYPVYYSLWRLRLMRK